MLKSYALGSVGVNDKVCVPCSSCQDGAYVPYTDLHGIRVSCKLRPERIINWHKKTRTLAGFFKMLIWPGSGTWFAPAEAEAQQANSQQSEGAWFGNSRNVNTLAD